MAKNKIKKEYRIVCEVINHMNGKIAKVFDLGVADDTLTEARKRAKLAKEMTDDMLNKRIYRIYCYKTEIKEVEIIK